MRKMFNWSVVVAFAASTVLGAGAQRVEAFSDGIFDQARVGCFPCHGGLAPPNTTTQLVVDGLPEDEGYVPGESYELTVVVLGVGIPFGPSLLTALAGFNLEASAGSLELAEGYERAQVRLRSECQVLQSARGCDPSATCGVTTSDGDGLCRTLGECYSRWCDPETDAECRECSEENVDIQAAHTASGGISPINAHTDGNNIPVWNLTWIAPSPAIGDVSFHMAGNAVNGNGANDPGDLWSVLEPPIVVPQQP